MKVGLIFPGQGSQAAGMGRGLEAMLEPWEQETNLPLVMWTTRFSDEQLKATDVAQPAIAAVSLALLYQLGDWPVVAVAGHSLGEFSALAACGALSPVDVLHVVAIRGRLMAQAPAGTMAAVMGLEADQVARVLGSLDDTVVVANDNAPGQVVISGSLAGLQEASRKLKQIGARRVLPLAVGGAFHSPLMGPALIGLRAALAKAPFRDAVLPLVTNVDAVPTQEAAQWPDKLARQLTAPVLWQQVVQSMQRLGVTHWLEVGPGKVLAPMVRRILPEAVCETISTPADIVRVRELWSHV